MLVHESHVFGLWVEMKFNEKKKMQGSHTSNFIMSLAP